jgi:hypothetical protein
VSTNDYNGATTVTGGTLSASAGALGGTSGITVNGATLTAVDFKSGSDLTTDATGSATISGTAGQSCWYINQCWYSKLQW